ncbi:MAG: FmdB family zinc ribbon protein [Acidobacteriota bacterium]
MPLYEYECEQCSNRFELIRKFSDPPLDACPKCGGPVRKLFSSPAIQFKGSGWYITDYAKKSSTEAGQSGGGSKSSEKSESGGKSDSDGKSGSGSADSSSKSDAAPAPASTDSSSKPSTPKTD